MGQAIGNGGRQGHRVTTTNRIINRDIIMNETDYLNQWMNGSPYQAFFQELMTWTDSYMQQNVGVSLFNGESSEADEARLESWASNQDNVYAMVSALASQPFYQQYIASLPEGEAANGDMFDGLNFDELFGGAGFGDDIFDGSYDDTPDGPPYSPVLSEDQVEDMALLYQAALNRTPDNAGLDYFVGNLREGQALQDIARSFYQSDEFRGQFEEFDDSSYINQLYVNVLGREADQAGLDYWVTDIQQNGRSHADVLVSFAQSDENSANAAWLSGLQFDSNTDGWMI